MADVAARAGVSVKTVSRVVNGESYVASDTTARVQEAVQALGFRANLAAATLARGRGVGTIGLMIGDVANPFYAQLARGVEEVATGGRHVVLVSSSDENPQRELEIVETLADRHVVGLVAVPTAEWSAEPPYPVVFVDRPGPGDSVLTDNAAGAEAGVAHLLDRGCRRVAVVGNEAGVYTTGERVAGYRRAHAARGVAVDEALIALGPRSVADAEAAVAGLLASAAPPDAIFGLNDLMAIGAWRAAHAAGVRPAIVGFDDFELADVLDPPVTVVLQDAVELGRRAAALLFERLAGYAGPERAELVPTQLVLR